MNRHLSQFAVQTQNEYRNETYDVIRGNSYTVTVSLQLSSFPIEVVNFNLGGTNYVAAIDDAGNYVFNLSSDQSQELSGVKQLSMTTSSEQFGAKKIYLGRLKFIHTENNYSDGQNAKVSDIFFQIKITDDFRLSSDISYDVITGKQGEPGGVSILQFHINDEMHLMMEMETNSSLEFEIDDNGHLLLTA